MSFGQMPQQPGMPPGGMPQQALDLQQLQALQKQAQGHKFTTIFSLAVNLFIHDKVETVEDAFILAEQFINVGEKRFMQSQQPPVQGQ